MIESFSRLLNTDERAQKKEATTLGRLLRISGFGKVADAKLIVASSKAQRIVLGSLYLRKESGICDPCFTKQQAKNTGNCFAAISNMNGIQLKKYLCANAETPITVPLS